MINKNCPKCKTKLSNALFNNAEVDFCDKCLGVWFQDQELRIAKDAKDKDLNWLDVDIWKDEIKFKISQGIRLCPDCRFPLYEVYYANSKIIVDVCNLCHGIWLDRGEFIKIIEYLKKQADYNIFNNYAKTLLQEAKEVFSGPETIREELEDFIVILKILQYKLASRFPAITDLISKIPR